MTGFFNISETDTKQIHRKQSELEYRTGHRWRIRITQGFASPRMLHILMDGAQVAQVRLPIEETSPVHIVCSELEREAGRVEQVHSQLVH